jgi:hypothetical protein
VWDYGMMAWGDRETREKEREREYAHSMPRKGYPRFFSLKGSGWITTFESWMPIDTTSVNFFRLDSVFFLIIAYIFGIYVPIEIEGDESVPPYFI